MTYHTAKLAFLVRQLGLPNEHSMKINVINFLQSEKEVVVRRPGGHKLYFDCKIIVEVRQSLHEATKLMITVGILIICADF